MIIEMSLVYSAFSLISPIHITLEILLYVFQQYKCVANQWLYYTSQVRKEMEVDHLCPHKGYR